MPTKPVQPNIMKSSKVLFTASLLAMGLVTAAQADVTFRYTGSSAFRGATHTAIRNALTSGSFAYVGTDISKANQAIFKGILNGTQVTIATDWTGSEAGIQAVAQDGVGLAVAFLPDATPVTSGGASGATAGTEMHIPDVAMSDTYQATSQFNKNAKFIISGTTHTYSALKGANSYVEGTVGVVPFKWIASNHGAIGTSGTITNITPQLIKNLYAAGSAELSLATGNAADATTTLLATGRNPDSGTRLTAFAESGYGALGVVTQYKPLHAGVLVSAINTAVDDMIAWPIEFPNGVSTKFDGNSGYDSGGNLGKALGADTSAVGIFIGYLSTGDADNAITSGGIGKELAYNGVMYSLTAVQQGQYPFWSYEHMYYRSGSPIAAYADKIALQIHNTDAPVKLGDMAVSRTADGSPITHN